MSTGSPQGCILSPLLFSLLTHDCIARHSTNHIVHMFADDTTVVGLITDNDESAYRTEVEQLAVWCRSNNLDINVDKTKEIVIDFMVSGKENHKYFTINGDDVEKVSSVRFLGVHLTDDLSFSINSTASSRKHKGASTPTGDSGRQDSPFPTSLHSTGAPLKTS